jgi:hypothetical protein
MRMRMRARAAKAELTRPTAFAFTRHAPHATDLTCHRCCATAIATATNALSFSSAFADGSSIVCARSVCAEPPLSIPEASSPPLQHADGSVELARQPSATPLRAQGQGLAAAGAGVDVDQSVE